MLETFRGYVSNIPQDRLKAPPGKDSKYGQLKTNICHGYRFVGKRKQAYPP